MHSADGSDKSEQKNEVVSTAETKRDRFAYLSPVNTNSEPPLVLISKLYTEAKLPEQKQACLRYLLHYQHYNAEFTRNESHHLYYPEPLCAPQEHPGYIRTEYHRLLDLMQPWIDQCLEPFYGKSFEITSPTKPKIIDYIKLSTEAGTRVLKTFFSQQYSIEEIGVFLQNDKKAKEAKKNKGAKQDTSPQNNKPKIVLIRITPADLSHTALDILLSKLDGLKPSQLRTVYRDKLRFLFLLQVPGIDFTIAWGIKWANLKENKLASIALNSKDGLFGDSAFHLLDTAGAVPDRLAVNQFMTHALAQDIPPSFNSDLKALGITPLAQYETEFDSATAKAAWQHRLATLQPDEFKQDPGSQLYCEAILRWQKSFFEKYEQVMHLVAPLLYSQVLPWISTQANIVQWAKAYQNFCEIVMLCLEYFPELNVDLDFTKTVTLTLPAVITKESKEIDTRVGLYPYAMTAIFDVLTQSLQRAEFTGRPLNAACIIQNYFETLDTADCLANAGHFQPIQKVDYLSEIKQAETLDILIADIHPNNAARERLYQNDIEQWVNDHLNRNPGQRLILVLDVTLNHLADDVIQQTLRGLSPFIKSKRLEIFLIQSLAKLMQLGADNFSGGACVYLGYKESKYHPPITFPQKAKYYAFLMQHGRDLTHGYFMLVRENARWMYRKLRYYFANIQKTMGFCAIQVTPNVDQSTVYVPLNFQPLLTKINSLDAEGKEKLVSKLRKLILELAKLRGLPVTGRQSFGFSLSNMSDTVCAIRFSIGVENEPLRQQYVNLLKDFCYALSHYMANKLNEAKQLDTFDFEEFRTGIIKIYTILQQGETPEALPWAEIDEVYEGGGEDGDEYHKTGRKAAVRFKHSQLELHLRQPTDNKIEIVPESDLEIQETGDKNWAYEGLFRLFFNLTFIQPRRGSIYFEAGQTALCGFTKIPYLLTNNSRVRDEKSGITVVFEPEFKLITKEGVHYPASQVFVESKEKYGPVPVPVSDIDNEPLNEVFVRCVQCDMTTAPDPHHTKQVLLQFSARKAWINYYQRIEECYDQGRLPAVVEFVNGLNLKHLPLHEHQSWWQYTDKPLDHLYKALEKIGARMMDHLTIHEVMDVLKLIDTKCGVCLLGGIMAEFFENCLRGKTLERYATEAVAFMFSLSTLQKFIDVHYVNRIILKIHQFINTSLPHQVTHLPLYFTAMFPLIQYCYHTPGSLCDTEHSIPLQALGEWTKDQFPSLLRHITDLEYHLPAYLQKTLRKKYSITTCLQFYIRYPLSDVTKRQLLTAIKGTPVQLRSQWLDEDYMIYSPIEQWTWYGFKGEPEDYVFLDAGDRIPLARFFIETGCKAILLNRLFKEGGNQRLLITAMRWAIITQDAALFLAILRICRSTSLDPDVINNLIKYRPYLDREDRVQHELANLLLMEENLALPMNLFSASVQPTLSRSQSFPSFFRNEHHDKNIDMDSKAASVASGDFLGKVSHSKRNRFTIHQTRSQDDMALTIQQHKQHSEGTNGVGLHKAR